jgi:hypothetical protein
LQKELKMDKSASPKPVLVPPAGGAQAAPGGAQAAPAQAAKKDTDVQVRHLQSDLSRSRASAGGQAEGAPAPTSSCSAQSTLACSAQSTLACSAQSTLACSAQSTLACSAKHSPPHTPRSYCS